MFTDILNQMFDLTISTIWLVINQREMKNEC